MHISNFKRSSSVIAVVLASAITGCATQLEQIVVHDNSLVLNKISESADMIKADLNTLAKVESYNNAEKVSQFKEPSAGPLIKKITLRWNGPAKPAVQMITKMIGYEFRESGTAPVNMLPIDIDVNQRAAFKVLEDIGLSTGNKIGVLVNEKLKLVQIVYNR